MESSDLTIQTPTKVILYYYMPPQTAKIMQEIHNVKNMQQTTRHEADEKRTTAL